MRRAILIVDDSPVMRSFIRRSLAIAGFEVTECYSASDGEEALELLGRHHIDVVISDVNMPRLDGEMFLSRLTADRSLHSVPVVMVSSDRTRDRAERLLGMGARAYLAKPFHPEALTAALERVLEERHD